MRRKAGAVAVAVALGAAMIGCGGGDGEPKGSDEDQIRAAVSQYLQATEDRDGFAACEVLSEGARELFLQLADSCSEGFEIYADGRSNVIDPEARRVDVNGELAIAYISTLDGDLQLKQVDDEWVITDGV